jgi:serine/threonine protein kinase
LGVLHRDLKPANVLLDKRKRARVADFDTAYFEGCVDLLAGVHGDQTRKPSRAIGTSYYMSPECLSGREYGRPSDVYSWAMLAWEVWYRRQAFPEVNQLNLFELVVEQGARPPQVDQSWFAVLLQRCFDADPQRRPTFSVLVGELRHHWHSAPEGRLPGDAVAGKSSDESLVRAVASESSTSLQLRDLPGMSSAFYRYVNLLLGIDEDAGQSAISDVTADVAKLSCSSGEAAGGDGGGGGGGSHIGNKRTSGLETLAEA